MVFDCEATSSFGKEWLRFDFQACSRDCTGASVTDGLLAAHALYWALSIGSLPSGTLRRTAVGCLLANCAWSATGALVWLQPGGRRNGHFDLLFRVNALCQALLIYAWWQLFTVVLRGTRCQLTRNRRLALSLGSSAHALAFAWRTLHTPFEAYVLCGGANVTPPLTSLWLCICWLCYRHGLYSRWRRGDKSCESERGRAHPLLLGASAGLFYWIGNSAIFTGAHRGLAVWMRHLLERLLGIASLPPEDFEEMACFHLFGMMGNACLFRAYKWLAIVEAQAQRAQAKSSQRVSQGRGGRKLTTHSLSHSLWLEAALKLADD